jgi:hypothetical protein
MYFFVYISFLRKYNFLTFCLWNFCFIFPEKDLGTKCVVDIDCNQIILFHPSTGMHELKKDGWVSFENIISCHVISLSCIFCSSVIFFHDIIVATAVYQSPTRINTEFINIEMLDCVIKCVIMETRWRTRAETLVWMKIAIDCLKSHQLID